MIFLTVIETSSKTVISHIRNGLRYDPSAGIPLAAAAAAILQVLAATTSWSGEDTAKKIIALLEGTEKNMGRKRFGE